MKPLLLFLAVVTPLWVFSQGGPVKDPSTPPLPGEKAEALNQPPLPGGAVPGRFLVQMLQSQGESHLAIRVDTFTGRTWTLERTERQEKLPAGAMKVSFFEYWKESLEHETMDRMKQREETPAVTPK